MAQHFLRSAKARTLSLARAMRLSDAEAYERSRRSVGPIMMAADLPALRLRRGFLLRLMTKRVGVALRHQRERDTVQSMEGPGQYMLWALKR